MDIILGSSSPRRSYIISRLVDRYRVVHPSIDESHRPSEDPVEFSLRIAGEKCASILETSAPGPAPALIITADTIVTIDGRVIGKPADFDHAVAMLSSLAGRTHRVITSLTLMATEGGAPVRTLAGHEITRVRFRKLDREGIIRYLGGIDYLDKAGSYAIQEHGDMIVEEFTGSITNIIGFPLRLFFSMLADMGLVDRFFGI
jgi:septum formation protein